MGRTSALYPGLTGSAWPFAALQQESNAQHPTATPRHLSPIDVFICDALSVFTLH
jgi:hypothetical protein